MEKIYLDNAATTRVREEVLDVLESRFASTTGILLRHIASGVRHGPWWKRPGKP